MMDEELLSLDDAPTPSAQPSVLETLLDPMNEDTVTLYGENGQPLTFEQVAVIPIDEKIYAILKPISQMDGVGADEALVFVIEEEEGEAFIRLETDEELCEIAFQVYYTLLGEEA